MAGQHGVKETGEALLALLKLGKFVAKRLEDGADLGDALALYNKLTSDGEFRNVFNAGIEGYQKIAGEVSEIDLMDALELAKLIPEMTKIVAA